MQIKIARKFIRTSKLDNKWTPYYRIIEQTSPVSFKVKNQLTGKSTKAHARHLRPANIDNWEIPKDKLDRHLRKSVYVAPPDESEDSLSDAPSSEVELPRAKMTKWARKEREDWSSEDDIPLMELKKRIRNKKFEPNIENKLVETDMDVSEDEISTDGERDIEYTKKPRKNYLNILLAKAVLAACSN
jgi:hypothetical protein